MCVHFCKNESKLPDPSDEWMRGVGGGWGEGQWGAGVLSAAFGNSLYPQIASGTLSQEAFQDGEAEVAS